MANVIWTGDAKAVAYTRSYTVGGTIGTETFTFTINGKDIAYTADGAQTAAQVATAIQALLAASTEPEFREVTWTNPSSAVVTATGVTSGKPITISTSASGSATITGGTETVATGPNHWDNADNWSGGAVPVSTDDVFIEGGADILYGLDQSAVDLTSLTIRRSYSGRIGLPPLANADQAVANRYTEYRDRYLKIGATTVTIGDGSGLGSGRIKLDLDTTATTVNVYGTGAALENGVPALLIKGANASNALNVLRGSVGVAFYGGETATFPNVRTSYMTQPDSDVTLVLGAGVTLTNVDALGGTVEINGATTTLDISAGTVTVNAGAHAAIVMDGGTLYYRSTGTVTALTVANATADFSRDPRSRTVTTPTLYKGATVRDPNRTVAWTNGLDLTRCRISDVTLDLGSHINLAVSAA